MEMEPEGGGQERMTCSDRSLLLAYLSGKLNDLDQLNAALCHLGECEHCWEAVFKATKGVGLPRYEIKAMGEGDDAGEDYVTEKEKAIRQELKRMIDRCQELNRDLTIIETTRKVSQRRMMVELVRNSRLPMTPRDITEALRRAGYEFEESAPHLQENSVYQVCRFLEEHGRLVRVEGAGLAYRAAEADENVSSTPPRKVLAAMQPGVWVTCRELADYLQVSVRSIRRYLRRLMLLGLIERRGADREREYCRKSRKCVNEPVQTQERRVFPADKIKQKVG